MYEMLFFSEMITTIHKYKCINSLLVLVTTTAANTSNNETKEAQQCSNRDDPVTPGTFLEKRLYHVMACILRSYKA